MLTRAGLLLVAMLPIAFPAAAQTFPDRPIHILVPINPGGGTDVYARRLAELAAPLLGQRVVVENRPGSSGLLGVQQVVDSPPDGYTLGFVWNTPLTAAPHTLKARFTPESYTSVFSVGYSPYTLCAQPDFPANSLPEFIDQIRAHPDEYTWGNEGLGGAMHLGVEGLLRRLELKMQTVPFQGAGQTLPAFLGRHITFYGGSLVGAMSAARAGTAKCLLLTTPTGNPELPNAGGLASIGMSENAVTIWWGMIAPNGIPKDRMERLLTAFLDAARSPRFRDTVESGGGSYRLQLGPEMAQAIRDEHALLREVALATGLARER